MDPLLRDVLHQIAGEPRRFIAELLQSAALVGIIVWAGRRYVARRLTERRAGIEAALAQAERDEQESARVREEWPMIIERAKASGAELLVAARAEAARERETQHAAIESEAREVVVQARRTVESERERVQREASERLLRLTTETARRYIEEVLSETERRALIHKAIEAFVEDLHPGETRTVRGTV